MATASSSFYKGSDDLDLTCDVCQHQNKTSIAVSYCETCEEALCQTCDNVHRNQKLTRTHSLQTGEQLIDIKLVKQFRELGNVQDTSHVDDSVPGRKQGTSGPGGSVAGRMPGTSKDHGSVPGRVNYSDRDTDTVPSVLDLAVSDIKHHSVDCKRVMSVVFMPSRHIVLACGGHGLKYACKVSDTEVLVSQGYEKQIQFVEILPKMVAKNVLTIERDCEGVCYHNGEIYVTCPGNPSNGEVRVVQMDGTVVRRLGVHDGTYMFTEPYDVKVNNAGDKVFVTDWGTSSVTCMDQKSGVLYKYTELRYPTGMLVDRQDNVLVTAYLSHSVHVVNKEGKKHKIVLSVHDGLLYPWCISYRHDDGLLAVGMFSNYGIEVLRTLKTSQA